MNFIQDLLVTLSTLLRGSVYERLRWTFKLYDLNGDGRISRGELSEIVLAIHELMGRRPHQPEDDRKARDQVSRSYSIYTKKLRLSKAQHNRVLTLFFNSCYFTFALTEFDFFLRLFKCFLFKERKTL